MLLNAAGSGRKPSPTGNGASGRMLAFRDEVHPAGAHHGQKAAASKRRAGPARKSSIRRRKPVSPRRTAATAKPAALVAGGDRAQRRAHARRRCLYVEGSQADRRLVEALGGTKQSPQVRSIRSALSMLTFSINRARRNVAAGAQEDIDAGEGEVAEAIWQGLELLILRRHMIVIVWAPGVEAG